MGIVLALKVSMSKNMKSAEEKILDNGFEDVVIFKDFSYDSALIGVSDDNRAIYDFDLMIDWLIEEHGWTEQESIEWIEYNSIRALPYYENSPIIMHRLMD